MTLLEIIHQYWRAYLGFQLPITGAAMTLWITVLAVVLGALLSLPMAVFQASNRWYLHWPVQVYTFIFRGTPLYVQLLIIYTGIYSLQVVRENMVLNEFFRSGFNCTILAFTINTCAYMTEVLAGAIRATPHGEIEAAQAYGFSTWSIYTKVILPSALRRSLPLYSNEVILTLHATSIAFTATVPEILKVARDVNSATFNSFAAFIIAAVLYAVIAFTLVAIFRRLEAHYMRFLKPSSAH